MQKSYNIYISYDKDLDNNSIKWIESMRLFLTETLEKISDKKINIYPLSKSLDKNVLNDIYIIILTDSYCTSGKSLNELETIFSIVNTEYNRIFKVLKTNIPNSQQPQSLKNLLSYSFFEKHLEKIQLMDFDESMVYKAEKKYWEIFADLSFGIIQVINNDSETDSNNKNAIYISEPESNQIGIAEELRREFQRHNFTVYPDRILSTDIDELKEEVIKYLSKSELAVHIVGSKYGELSSNAHNFSVSEMQNQVAGDYYSKHKKYNRIIWIPENGTNMSDDIVIERLKRNEKDIQAADIVQVNTEKLKNIILEKLKTNINKNVQKTSSLKYNADFYIVQDFSSTQEATDLINAFALHKISSVRTEYKGEDLNILHVHREKLVEVENVVILYNNENENWLFNIIQDIYKARGLGKKQDFKSITIIAYSEIPKDIDVSNINTINGANLSFKEICDSIVSAVD